MNITLEGTYMQENICPVYYGRQEIISFCKPFLIQDVVFPDNVSIAFHILNKPKYPYAFM